MQLNTKQNVDRKEILTQFTHFTFLCLYFYNIYKTKSPLNGKILFGKETGVWHFTPNLLEMFHYIITLKRPQETSYPIYTIRLII